MYTYLDLLLNHNKIENKDHILYSVFGMWDGLNDI